MFGNPEWFHDATRRIPVPNQPKGWLYFIVWASVIAVPAALLMSRGLIPEVAVWGVLASVCFFWDLRKIRQIAKEKKAYESLYFIRDANSAAETDHYRIEIKS